MTVSAECQRWEELSGRRDVDGTLSADEARFVSEHLQVCPDCAATASFWASLGSEHPDVKEFAPPEAAKVDALLLSQGITVRRRPRWVRRAVTISALAASVAALIVWGTQEKIKLEGPSRAPPAPVAEVAPPVPVEPPPEPSPLIAKPSVVELVLRGEGVLVDGRKAQAGQRLIEGQVMTATRGGACLRIEPSIVACLSAGGALKVAATQVEHRQLELLRGTVVSSLAHQPEGTRFSVISNAGVVTAVGTIFAVERTSRAVRARVHEGVVSVRSARGRESRLAQGDALVLGEEVTTKAQPQRAHDLNAIGPASLWRDALSSAVMVDSVPTGAPVSIDGVTVGKAPLELALTPGHHVVKVTAPGKAPIEEDLELSADEHAVRRYVLKAARLTSAPQPTAKPAPSAIELLNEARALRSQDDLAGAIRVYRQLMKRYPTTDEARVSRVALGDLMLERKPAQALAEYDAYLAAQGGSLELEARFGRVRALKALGRDSEARSAAQALIRDHPSSMQARTLRSELDAGR